ncbi:hypothetical protein NPIL_425741 [Nephila pilipes]|uniref:Uncharacterized protein n=1 Tax=Nephila pilipes TaxID=299642 RepID=A0A8X6Q9B6_NEPPI|nr:hypothetical protein NPIL_425741 [Nephila pilipes]
MCCNDVLRALGCQQNHIAEEPKEDPFPGPPQDFPLEKKRCRNVDCSKVAALALTTPRAVGESSTEDSAPPHHTSFELGGSGQKARGKHSRVCPRTAQITEKASSAPNKGT